MDNPWIDVQIPEGLLDQGNLKMPEEESQEKFLEENSDGTLGQVPLSEDHFLTTHRQGWIILSRIMNSSFPVISTRGVFESREEALTVAMEKLETASAMTARLHAAYHSSKQESECHASTIVNEREGNAIVSYAEHDGMRVRLGWVTAAWFDLDEDD